MKNKTNIILSIILLLITLTFFTCLYMQSPPSKESKEKTFIIEEGTSLKTIASNLKKEGLIRNEKFFFKYMMLKNARKIYAGKYELNTNMKMSKIIKALKAGGKNIDEITITFKEGLNARQIAKLIEKETNNSYEDVLKQMTDRAYLNEIIKKYPFLKNINDQNIYYPLEGYLYPDTYNFSSKSASVKEMFSIMLSNFNNRIAKEEQNIKKSKYNLHQILTIASILELEANDKNSRKDIAGVFYNRLANNMPLGSDVTTYYGVKKEMNSNITQSEIDSINPYNTRLTTMAGKLPVGPICNPSISSINAALNPTKHEYLYFVADKNGKIYLTKNYQTHNKVIKDLKNKGLWLEW